MPRRSADRFRDGARRGRHGRPRRRPSCRHRNRSRRGPAPSSRRAAPALYARHVRPSTIVASRMTVSSSCPGPLSSRILPGARRKVMSMSGSCLVRATGGGSGSMSDRESRQTARSHGRGRPSGRVVCTTVVTVALVAMFAAMAFAAAPVPPTVGSASNAKFGEKIVVDVQGRTLYVLSPETTHHLLCKSSECPVWPPLTVRSSKTKLTAGPGVHGHRDPCGAATGPCRSRSEACPSTASRATAPRARRTARTFTASAARGTPSRRRPTPLRSRRGPKPRQRPPRPRLLPMKNTATSS